MTSDDKPNAQTKLYEFWAKRNVYFEVDLEDTVIRKIADYGSGANQYNSDKGFSLGGGYEVYILAFFIGLYSNSRRPIKGEKKKFGQPIQYWGNIESRLNRKAYTRLREYIFMAAIARTDIDLLALERGEIQISNAISSLITTMDEYANYGFHVLLGKLEEDKHFFTKNMAFLQVFMPLFKELNKSEDVANENESDGPESLD